MSARGRHKVYIGRPEALAQISTSSLPGACWGPIDDKSIEFFVLGREEIEAPVHFVVDLRGGASSDGSQCPALSSTGAGQDLGLHFLRLDHFDWRRLCLRGPKA